MNDVTCKEYQSRDCAVCGGNRSTLLYRQRFSPMSGGLITGYDVVLCNSCGFAYADRLPAQEDFDRYYREMSKYEYHASGGVESPYDTARFVALRDILLPFLPDREARVVDVGCATGKFLSLLSEQGFGNVSGLDPSPGCASVAHKLYGVRVVTGSVAELPLSGEIYHCIVLNGVLEHLLDPKSVISLLCECLSEQGLLCIVVPDATRFAAWDDAPFQQFSVEHINFFSQTSLLNLLAGCGFRQLACFQSAHLMSSTTVMPVVTALFTRSEPQERFQLDAATEAGLRAYLNKSIAVENFIGEMIGRIVEQGTSIIVWGAGTHTLHLLETTALPHAKIVAFVDTNESYWGRSLNGVEIVSPASLTGRPEPILISSRVFQDKIEAMIRRDLALPNEIVTLYRFDALPDLAAGGVRRG